MKYSDTTDNNIISFDKGKERVKKKKEIEQQELKVKEALFGFDPNAKEVEREIEKAMYMFISYFQENIEIPENKEQDKIDGLMWSLNQVLRSIYYYMNDLEYPLQDEIWEAWDLILGDDEFLTRQGDFFE